MQKNDDRLNSTELILIVDDDAVVRGLLHRMLHSDGYRCEEAANGTEALEKYERLRPNLVLVDALMPVMDGFELCERIQRLPREQQVPLIMITALNDQKSINRAFLAGATDYIPKPIVWPMLRHRLRLQLTAQRTQRELAERHNLLRTLIDNIPDYIYVKDRDHRYLLSNAAHTARVKAETGTNTDIIGKTDADLRPHEVAEQFQLQDTQVLIAGEPQLNIEHEFIDEAGNQRWVLTTKVPLRDPDGSLTGVVGIGRDITERKLVEQVVQESDDRFRLLLQNSMELITVLNEAGVVSYQSSSIERLLGVSTWVWLGHPLQKFVHPDDWPFLKPLLVDISQQPGQPLRLSCRVMHANGGWRVLEGTGYRLDDPALSGIVLNFHDTTEHQQIEQSLLTAEAAEHEQRLLAEALRDTAAALANTLDPAVVMDHILVSIGQVVPHDSANIMLIDGDEAYIVALHGYDAKNADQVKGLRLSLDLPNMRQITETHGPLLIPDTALFPGWIIVPQTTWIRSFISAPIEVHGHIIGFLNLDSRQPNFFNAAHGQRLQAFSDQVGMAIENAHLYEQLRNYAAELEMRIDDRTRELSHAKEHAETILHSTSDAILVVQADGTIQQTNRRSYELFGYQEAEFVAQSIVQVVPPGYAAALLDKLHVAVQGGLPQYLEIDARRKDGTVFNAEIGLSPIQRDSRAAPSDTVEVVCSIRDITERKQLELELQALNQLKTEFLSTAAHELRTPLASILGFSEILLNRSLDSDRSKRYLTIIYEQSVQLRKIVDALLDISRIESKQGLVLNLQPVDINQLVTQTLTYFSEYLPKYQFQMEGLADCPLIMADPFRLGQVLQNLVSNAVKYSPDGGLITIRGTATADRLQISVQDQGIGMTAEQQTHLFERFYRADASNTTMSGTGLGLAISKLIIELHGGQIAAKSEHRVGTTVTFTLPRAATEALSP